MLKKIFALIFCLISIHSAKAYAQESQDTYEPFIDYDEFEVADEEEADVNFFRNGRFLTLGFMLGSQQFTQGMGDLMKRGTAYGLYLSYFFDLRFALQFGYLTSSHAISVTDDQPKHYTGTSTLNVFSIDG